MTRFYYFWVMFKTIQIFLIIFFCCIIAQAQRFYVVGKVQDAESKKNLAGARVYNQNAKAGSYTQTNGMFFVWANSGDSIKVSAKGHYHIAFLVKNMVKDTVIVLSKDPTYVTLLDEVVVEGKRPEQMKREIKELISEAPETGQFDNSSLITAGGSGGAGLSINALYDYFSTQGKDHRKADMLKQKSKYKFYSDWKLNPKLITRLTGLKGTMIDAFIAYMHLDEQYVLRASDYELNATILGYYDAFRIKNNLPLAPKK